MHWPNKSLIFIWADQFANPTKTLLIVMLANKVDGVVGEVIGSLRAEHSIFSVIVCLL